MTEPMRGRVGEGAHEALLTLTVASLDPSGSQTELEAVVDTGFTGALCLGTEQIESLGLPLLGRGAAVLADGRAVETRYHRGQVIWHDREREVQVICADGGPLVGMALLRGGLLTIEVAPGGEVSVVKLV
jgi:clan AA aspartic protease